MESEPNLHEIQMVDGRTLAYACFGDPNGRPVFYFHGFPGCRLEPAFAHDTVTAAGVRMIAIDRPGFGHSTRKPGRSILDWPDDVVELADALDIESFAVMGVSGGGPYAVACAARVGERLTHVAIVAGLAPLDRTGGAHGMTLMSRVLFGSARYFPPLTYVYMWAMASMLKRGPERTIERMSRSMPEPDRIAIDEPEFRASYAGAVVEAIRQGPRPAVEEARLFASPWGFQLTDIAMPVSLFQGERDVNVAPAMGHYQAETIPNCDAHFYPDEGHISVSINRMDEIVASLGA